MKKIPLLLVIAFLAAAANGFTQEAGFQPLFNGKDLTGWKFQLKDEKADPAKTFVVKNGVIEVSGFPNGYLYTDKSFSNYTLRYTWRYPKEQPEKTTMNSGLLMHIQEPHKVWPISIEPQGRYKNHGQIFMVGMPKDGKYDNKFDEEAQKKALKESHEWQTTEATSTADGVIEVRLNGILVSSAKSPITSGPIGFQSEAARIDLKDIQIKLK